MKKNLFVLILGSFCLGYGFAQVDNQFNTSSALVDSVQRKFLRDSLLFTNDEITKMYGIRDKYYRSAERITGPTGSERAKQLSLSQRVKNEMKELLGEKKYQSYLDAIRRRSQTKSKHLHAESITSPN